MNIRTFILLLAGLLSLVACSEEDGEWDGSSVKRLFNDMKGSYAGKIINDGGPQSVTIRIGTDFTIENLPLKPILQHAVTDASQLSEALKATPTINYTAEIDSIDITSNVALLKMLPTDMVFKTSYEGGEHTVAALMESSAYTTRSTSGLTVTATVKELFFDGRSIDVSTERIVYFVDNAIKLSTN